MDELHDLQDTRTGSPFELSFILLSQVKELLFRMVHLELDQARGHLRADRAGEACRALARATRTQRVLIACWESMNGMPADEFVRFRDVLGQASGTQSFAYRGLEFAMGNKNPVMVRPPDLRRYPQLRAEFERPSLYDEALRFLDRHGLPLPAATLDRDVTRQYEPDERVERAWQQVYADPAGHPEPYRLAEHLIEVAYQFSHWRAAHLLVVERMLGGKRGTAGTDGARWLREVNEHRFFPELWTARTLL
ncbi:tryptophan 2,3-dioxygenase [Actinomadura craniellae]|uniref:Tryptophan 2,3-dioxygenase n=2 Tax=Actinomadura craniellae TaxID=2231787 RepID=A0A365H111_9ACTN|nr:tryptophan 2,3-dioxygenase [Actinomadura craniellae]